MVQNNRLEIAERYIENANIEPSEKIILKKYMIACDNGNRVKQKSPTTIKSEILVFAKFGEYVQKPFREVEMEDIEIYLHDCKKRIQNSTASLYALYLKNFYIWLDNGEHFHKVDWIKGGKQTRKKIDETKLLSPIEIKSMILKARSSRDKAMVMGLYESACRVSEFLDIKIKDILFDDYGCKIRVNGKTGERNIRLIDSSSYFQKWLNDHEYKNNPEHDFFYNFADQFDDIKITKSSFSRKLKNLGKKAGIHKNIHPHLFRHSRLTWLAQEENFNERDLRIFAGWSSGSDMPDTYLHYGESEVDKKLRKIKGLLSDKDSRQQKLARKALNAKICPRCNKENTADSLYCNCGFCLDAKESLRIDDLKQRAIEQAIEELEKITENPERFAKYTEFKKKLEANI